MHDLGGSFPLTNNRQVFYMQLYIPGNVSQLRSTLVEEEINLGGGGVNLLFVFRSVRFCSFET